MICKPHILLYQDENLTNRSDVLISILLILKLIKIAYIWLSSLYFQIEKD